MILRAWRAWCLLVLADVCQCAYAAAPRPLLTDYTHSAWTELDGAPTGVSKFAQGPDGWLEIATPTGLYRFDGVRFERTDTVHGHRLDSSDASASSLRSLTISASSFGTARLPGASLDEVPCLAAAA